jgi:hypothetical protein
MSTGLPSNVYLNATNDSFSLDHHPTVRQTPPLSAHDSAMLARRKSRVRRSSSLSSLGSASFSSVGTASESESDSEFGGGLTVPRLLRPLQPGQSTPPKLRRRLSSRTGEWALRAKRRRDWVPPSWAAPFDRSTQYFLFVYFVVYAAAWFMIVYRS